MRGEGHALPFKIPISTLVLVHTPDLRVLLLERADYPGYWQSVTGSQEAGETLAQTATRELHEETGIDADAYGGVVDWQLHNRFLIFSPWQHPGCTLRPLLDKRLRPHCHQRSP